MHADHFEPVLRLSELREGRMRSCRIGERELVICRTRDGLFALDNVCTHAYSRMSEGYLRGTRLVCPLHGAAFDVRDGRVLAGPAVQPLRTYKVRVVEEMIEVSLGAE